MLDHFFKRPEILRRHRNGFWGAHLDLFVSRLAALGYSKGTVRHYCWEIRYFGRWLEQNNLTVAEINDDIVGKYLKKRRQRKTSRGDNILIIRFFIDHLKEKGVITSQEPCRDDSPLEQLIKRYEEYLRKERGVVQATVTNYIPYIRRFLIDRFADNPLRLQDIGLAEISGFIRRRITSMSPGRAKLMATALRSFFRFLLERGEIDVDFASALPAVANWRLSTVPKYLSPEQITVLLAACDRGTAAGRRNYAILMLMTRLGLRGGEVQGLNLDDINWRAGEIRVRGKGPSDDLLPLPVDVGEVLADYLLESRPHCAARSLFVRLKAPYRELANTSSISTIVRSSLQKACLNPPAKGAHILRHSLAVEMLRGGASMAEIGQVLRHRSAATTEIYAKVDFDALRPLAQPWPATGGEK